MGKRHRASLTAGMKKEVCQYKVEHPEAKLKDLIKMFSEKWDTRVGRTTIGDILRESEKWMAVSEHYEDIKRVSAGRYRELDAALFKLFIDARSHNELITDDWLLKNAHQIGTDMNITGFRYSAGWLAGFKRRYVIGKSKIAGKYTLICKNASVVHRPQHPGKRRPKRTRHLQLSEQQETLEHLPLGYVYEPNNDDCTLPITGRAIVTVEEARAALIKVITFLSSVAVGEDYLCLLFNVLKYLDNYGNSVVQSQNVDDVLVKYEDALMAPVNNVSPHEQANNGGTAESASDPPDIVRIKEENVSVNGDLQTDDDVCEDVARQSQSDIFHGDNGNMKVTEGSTDLDVDKQLVITKRRSDLFVPNEHIRQVNSQRKEDKYVRYVRYVDSSKTYECLICAKTFALHTRCRRHVKLVHSGERPFRCSICEKTFPENATLKKHLRVHTGEKPYLCMFCGKNLSTSTGLIIHIRCHTGERPYVCPVCNKSFSHPSGLSEHRRVHSTEKPYACTVCDRAFKRSTELSVHKRVHTGERPYKCVICDKSFAKWSYWRNHMRRHTGEKPYNCDHCNKSFAHRSLLNTHLRVHTGERPFCCAICGKRFSQSGSLYHHQRMHE
ncbi:hypothetical protein LSH36_362g01005 [Paralvinella palmiformis]|uniref:Uncharacterized protein n=1 Tax=Paralvinella palmiformis TaxID=53620 RepID=A0AAD9JG04_9ANNE|nr:hypothetical protein LSH36_362g01005 [Paralvinella palmiformis]